MGRNWWIGKQKEGDRARARGKHHRSKERAMGVVLAREYLANNFFKKCHITTIVICVTIESRPTPQQYRCTLLKTPHLSKCSPLHPAAQPSHSLNTHLSRFYARAMHQTDHSSVNGTFSSSMSTFPPRRATSAARRARRRRRI